MLQIILYPFNCNPYCFVFKDVVYMTNEMYAYDLATLHAHKI